MNKPIQTRNPATEEFNSSVHLKNAAQQAAERNYDDILIVDIDSHHYETEAFGEIANYIDDPVLRMEAKYQGHTRGGVTSTDGSYQEMTGRVTRYPQRKNERVPPKPHRDITLMHRWMDAMGVDIACMFPTPMLNIVNCPRIEVEVQLARAYNRWLCDQVLAEDPRIKSMLYLPFNDPVASLKMVEEFGDKPGVIGFMVVATHHRSVHDNAYMKLYGAMQERNLPLAFHAAYTWSDHTLSLTNRFMAVHALGFTWCNMLHMTNWLVNGLPERFPKLKVIWIESGLAWVPFLMQRLDNEYMMRTSDAPLLKKKPSDYMRDMYYTTQPMELVDNMEMLELTFKMMNANTQLLYSSDYPHWDMDLPSTIYDLPFLDVAAKKAILGENSCRLFNIEPVFSAEKLARRKQRAAGTPR
jgi:predicted TIM-barrel fold metal-dependent hydrolase